MKEIAILALARYGDHIQSTPLLRGLRRKYPHARITMIVEDRFAGILPLMQGYDRIIQLDKKELAWAIALADDPLVPYRIMERFVRQIENEKFDLLINLTCTKLSAYIASTMQAKTVTGITAEDDGERSIRTPWGLYVFSWFYDNNRPSNRINLVDIFTRLGGIEPDGQGVELFETEEGKAFAAAFLAEHNPEGKPLVGLQLGASEANRCWPTEQFAEISDRMQRELGVRTILFGSKDERELAEKALAAMETPAIDAVGKTDMAGLLSVVKACRLLVTNDTGTMHFAAAAGVPSVMLCIGPAFFRCTGPYSEGNLAVKPRLTCSPCPYGILCGTPICRTAITPEAVYNAVLLLLGKGTAETLDFTGVSIHRSTFGVDGYLTWQPVTAPDPGEEEGRRLERMWKHCLNGRSAGNDGPLPEAVAEFRVLMKEGVRVTGDLLQAAGKTPLPLEKINRLGAAEADIEAKMKFLGSRYPLLTPFVTYLTLMRENISGNELKNVARETEKLYRTGLEMSGCY